MKTRLAKIIGLAVMCLLLALPAISGAAAFRYDTETRQLFAGFSSVDETGCIETGVTVVAFVTEGSATDRLLSIAAVQADLCLGIPFISGDGQTTDFSFNVPSNLQKGSVAGTVTLFNGVADSPDARVGILSFDRGL